MTIAILVFAAENPVADSIFDLGLVHVALRGPHPVAGCPPSIFRLALPGKTQRRIFECSIGVF